MAGQPEHNRDKDQYKGRLEGRTSFEPLNPWSNQDSYGDNAPWQQTLILPQTERSVLPQPSINAFSTVYLDSNSHWQETLARPYHSASASFASTPSYSGNYSASKNDGLHAFPEPISHDYLSEGKSNFTREETMISFLEEESTNVSSNSHPDALFYARPQQQGRGFRGKCCSPNATLQKFFSLPVITKDQKVTLMIIAGQLSFSLIAWSLFSFGIYLLYPFQLISVLFHELGHATMVSFSLSLPNISP